MLHFPVISPSICKASFFKRCQKYAGLALAFSLALILCACALTDDPESPQTTLPSTAETTPCEQTTTPVSTETTSNKAPAVPDADVEIISNDASLNIYTVTIPLTKDRTDYGRYNYNDRYCIYSIRSRSSDDKERTIYIIDVYRGEIVMEYEADDKYGLISYTDDGILLHAHGNNTTKALKITEENGVFTITKVTTPYYPTTDRHYHSPDGEYAAYRTQEDSNDPGGVNVRYPDGEVKRILTNIIAPSPYGDSTQYSPVGFIDETKLLYTIVVEGYGIYDLATDEKTEIYEDLAPITFNGRIFLNNRHDRVWEVLPDNEKILLASENSKDGVFLLPHISRGFYGFDQGGAWYTIYKNASHTRLYPHVLTLYSPDFSTELAKIAIPKNAMKTGSAPNLHFYDNSVTIVLPTIEYEAPTPTNADLEIISNDAGININAVTFQTSDNDKRSLHFDYNDRYSINVIYSLSTDNMMIYIVDAHSGDVVWEAPAYHLYHDISYFENGCLLHSGETTNHQENTSRALKITEEDGIFACEEVDVPLYPFKYEHYYSFDGKYTAYRTDDDASGAGGVDVKYPDGEVRRVLTNIMLDDYFDGGIAGIADVTGYRPVGFIENTKLVYAIIAWEGLKGYGIYDLATNEKTEFSENSYPIIFNSRIFLTERKGTYSPAHAIWEISPDNKRILLASKNADDGVALLPDTDDVFYGFNNGSWYIIEENVSQNISYPYILILYSLDFKTELAKIAIPSEAIGNIKFYNDSVTVVLPKVQ